MASLEAVVADTYLNSVRKWLQKEQNLDEAFQEKYGIKLDEEIINQQNVKMVLVATDMNSGTERIITYLRNTYIVDINILFFRIFGYDDKRFISRARFTEDAEEAPAPVKFTGKWYGEYYVSFDVGSRRWEDAQQYGLSFRSRIAPTRRA